MYAAAAEKKKTSVRENCGFRRVRIIAIYPGHRVELSTGLNGYPRAYCSTRKARSFCKDIKQKKQQKNNI